MGNDEREPLVRLSLMGVIDRTTGVSEKYLPRSTGLKNAEERR